MEQENVVKKEKNGLKVLVVILLVLLIGVIMFIVGQYTSNNTNMNLFKNNTEETTKNNNTVKEDNTVKEEDKKTDETKVLDEITKVYKEAYQKMTDFNDPSNSILKSSFEKNNVVYTVNKDSASKYFTAKGINYLESNISNIESVLLGSIFNVTDSGKRPLTVVSESDDTVVATGQIINGVTLDGQSNEIDSDSYPLYIIFKKVNNTYKIDMFE